MKRWLAEQGCTFEQARGSHLKVFLGEKQTILPMHSRDLPIGTLQSIKKHLGLKENK